MIGRHPIDVVHVVVPARNEADLLPRLLDSLEVAVAAVRRVRADLTIRATVVLDSCTDGSAAVLARRPWVDVVQIESGVVGRVREHGLRRVCELAGDVDPKRVWVACTDADSVLPAHWLSEQLAFATHGAALVVGTVRPDPADLTPGALAAWRSRHRLGEGHTHVHGANLGFTLSAYDLVGGFAPVVTGEDVGLVARMRLAGVSWCATARTEVMTSGRRVGRAPDGFSSYLLELAP